MSTELKNALEFFITTFTELAVLFIIISFVVSVINDKLPPEKIKKLLSGNRGYGIAVSLGALTPFCSCSTLPMTIGLIKARAAFGPVMAFLFTSPLLNPFIVGLFWITFGAKVTLIYSAFVIVLAIVSGYFLEKFHFERFIKEDLLKPSCEEKSRNNKKEVSKSTYLINQEPITIQNKSQHWKNLLLDTTKQFISFAPYMMIAVAVGALLHGYVPQNAFDNLNGYNVVAIIPLAAVVGVFLYVRASTMVPIATALVAKGMSMGSVISLTIAGAGASLPEMIMMKRMFHWPLMFAFIFVVFATACITGSAIELL
ncbi:MAG: uncharacterized membrane protein YraQ (UPF0718 family) [Colwellia sp.]|jgi:uncharacterized membrane protein YraQ (UPF0718 family)